MIFFILSRVFDKIKKILCLDNSFWIILKRRRTENDKKNKKRTWRNW
ncbi:hypothetical protein [Spiroplasma endosymbiont of Clivina fossor]